jgi:Ser-tRNA(Ala) deacylase AlaX
MTDRLYYRNSFLYDFDAEIREALDNPRPALILDRSAFYPTSGGQVHDTGTITIADSNQNLRVTEVAETEDGRVVHYLEAPVGEFHRNDMQPGTRVRGQIDPTRYRPSVKRGLPKKLLGPWKFLLRKGDIKLLQTRSQ